MTPDEFKAYRRGPNIEAIVRCGANNGRCGKIDSAIDNAWHVEYNPAHTAHTIRLFSVPKDEWRFRPEIEDLLVRPKTDAERRSGKPREIMLVPDPYRRRKDRDQQSAEDWASYNAYRDRHGDIEPDDDEADPYTEEDRSGDNGGVSVEDIFLAEDDAR